MVRKCASLSVALLFLVLVGFGMSHAHPLNVPPRTTVPEVSEPDGITMTASVGERPEVTSTPVP